MYCAVSCYDIRMAYDTTVADRIRELLTGDYTIEERSMFGARGFMINGSLKVCVGSHDTMFKIGPDAATGALESGTAGPVSMNNRTMKSWVRIEHDRLTDDALRTWLTAALQFTSR